MMLRVFSIFDVKADTFSTPFFKATVGLALRDFGDLCSDRSTMPGRHPGDFKLVEIGEFDDLRGLLIPHEIPVSLGFGTDVIEKPAAVVGKGKVA